jgi:hypothetical protein
VPARHKSRSMPAEGKGSKGNGCGENIPAGIHPPHEVNIYMRECRAPTKKEIKRTMTSTSTRRVACTRVVPATEEVVKAIHKCHEDSANGEEEGREEEEDGGEGNVSNDLNGFEVLCEAVVVSPMLRLNMLWKLWLTVF